MRIRQTSLALLLAGLAAPAASGQQINIPELVRGAANYAAAIDQIQLGYIGKPVNEEIISKGVQALCPLFRKNAERTKNAKWGFEQYDSLMCENATKAPCVSSLRVQAQNQMRQRIKATCGLRVE